MGSYWSRVEVREGQLVNHSANAQTPTFSPEHSTGHLPYRSTEIETFCYPWLCGASSFIMFLLDSFNDSLVPRGTVQSPFPHLGSLPSWPCRTVHRAYEQADVLHFPGLGAIATFQSLIVLTSIGGELICSGSHLVAEPGEPRCLAACGCARVNHYPIPIFGSPSSPGCTA